MDPGRPPWLNAAWNDSSWWGEASVDILPRGTGLLFHLVYCLEDGAEKTSISGAAERVPCWSNHFESQAMAWSIPCKTAIWSEACMAGSATAAVSDWEGFCCVLPDSTSLVILPWWKKPWEPNDTQGATQSGTTGRLNKLPPRGWSSSTWGLKLKTGCLLAP